MFLKNLCLSSGSYLDTWVACWPFFWSIFRVLCLFLERSRSHFCLPFHNDAYVGKTSIGLSKYAAQWGRLSGKEDWGQKDSRIMGAHRGSSEPRKGWSSVLSTHPGVFLLHTFVSFKEPLLALERKQDVHLPPLLKIYVKILWWKFALRAHIFFYLKILF